MTFEEWTYRAVDPNHRIALQPAPVVTTLLYRVCDGDDDRFDEAMRLLKLAFEAGKEIGESSLKAG